jgi:two-component system response regulator AlgR
VKILVVDDESLARDRLLRLLDSLLPAAEVEQADSGRAALDTLATWQADLVLLDIRMPGMDGIAVARELQQLPEPPAVIFCTAFDRYALEALEQQAVAYLLKPVRGQQLREAIDKAGRVNRMQLAALSTSDEGRPYISSDGRAGMQRVPVEEIRCFIAEQKYVRACHPDGELLIPDTLKDLESEYPTRFLRIHRNSLVAPSHVVGLEREGGEGWCVALDAVPDRPPVSRRHLAEVRRKLRGG